MYCYTMSFFTNNNYEKNYFIFTVRITLWNVSLFYFFFIILNKQNIKSVFLALRFKIFLTFSMWQFFFFFFQLHLFIKDLTFGIINTSFLVFLWFNATVICYWKHLSSFFGFIIVFMIHQKNLYMIHRDLNISYYIYNAFRLSYQNQNRCFSLI